MNAIQYILISTACITVFYAFYMLISKNETNFRQLRLFLLASILISLLMPLSSYRIAFETAPNNNFLEGTEVLYSSQPVVNYTSVENSNPFIDWITANWVELLQTIYFIVFILLLTRIAVNLFILSIQYLKSERKRQDGYTIVYNRRFKNTFSFFNWIFINIEFSSKEDLDQIISHEKIHASQYHSLDLILIELLAAAMWFNPLVWMMRNSMQLVHEYLADEGALSTGIDRLKYQALLINQVTGERLICLSSSFNKSLIKKRMIMMTRSNFNQKTKLKILALFPASAVIFIITACINGLFPSHVKANSIAPIETSISQEFDSQQSKNLNSAEDTTKKVVVVGYGRMEDRSDVTILEDSDIADGVHVVGMKNISSDSTKSIENLENEGLKINATKKIGEKILTEHQNLNVTAVGVRRMENPKKINSDSINIEETRINYNTENGNRISVVVRKDGSNNQNLLYIVDGVPQPTDSDIKDIDPDKIESVSVLKNESATALYGEKAANGVILITTKGKSKQLFNFKADRLVIEGGNDKPIPNALYIIDGVKQSKEFDPNDLDPNQIKDITVLKDKDSIKLYTDKDHDGVLLITTKGK